MIFLLVKTNKPINFLKDLDGQNIFTCVDWYGVMQKINDRIIWATEDKAYFGNGLALNIGRFKIYINRKIPK